MTTPLYVQRRRSAFSLVELLVAMVVLLLMMILVTGMVNQTSRLTTASHGMISADSGGREALDRMTFDFGLMILRDDLPQKIDKPVGNDSIAFYAQAPAYAGDRGVSKIGFQIGTTGKLERGAEGSYWTSGTGQTQIEFKQASLPAIPSTDFEVMSSDVFRLEFAFLMQDGSIKAARTTLFGSTAANKVRAVIVGIAALDSNLRQQATGSIGDLAALLPDAQDGTDIASLWNPIVNSATFSTPAAGDPFPSKVRAGVRVYQKTIYLDY